VRSLGWLRPVTPCFFRRARRSSSSLRDGLLPSDVLHSRQPDPEHGRELAGTLAGNSPAGRPSRPPHGWKTISRSRRFFELHVRLFLREGKPAEPLAPLELGRVDRQHPDRPQHRDWLRTSNRWPGCEGLRLSEIMGVELRFNLSLDEYAARATAACPRSSAISPTLSGTPGKWWSASVCIMPLPCCTHAVKT